MEGFCFDEEIECLKSAFDSSEFTYLKSSRTPILNFFLKSNVSVTFEIPRTYPDRPPLLSITASELTNTERRALEDELRYLAEKAVGYPMIMNLVIELQQLVDDYHKKNVVTEQSKCAVEENQENYFAAIQIDHMCQKKKYSNTLTSWASELHISGCLLFYQRCIFLLLQGSKKYIKEFIIRHKTVCIDVDSAGKPCKEKMSKILYEGLSLANFSEFFIKELTSLEEVEVYFTDSNIIDVFKNVISPILMKNKSVH